MDDSSELDFQVQGKVAGHDLEAGLNAEQCYIFYFIIFLTQYARAGEGKSARRSSIAVILRGQGQCRGDCARPFAFVLSGSPVAFSSYL